MNFSHTEKYKETVQELKVIAPTQNKFELPDVSCSVSNIQDYFEFAVKKHKTLTTIPPILVYINIINKSSLFKIKDLYNLELQTPETIKLFGSTKNFFE